MENSNSTFSSIQRQSPAAIFILLSKTAVSILKVMWPALLVMIFSTSKNGHSKIDKFALFFVVLSAISVVFSLLHFWVYRFYVEHENFVVKEGWFKKKLTSIPLKNIIAVHIEQDIIHQILNVARVSLDSAGSAKMEVKIDALTLGKAEELKRFLLHERATEITEEVTIPKKNIASKLSVKQLLLLSITANHLEAFALLFVLSMNVWNDLEKAFKIDGWKWMEQHSSSIENSVIISTIIIFTVITISVIYSAIRTILKFYGFTILEEANGWKISFGLTTHKQKFVPFTKIQVLSWQSNFVRRKLDVWIMHILSAGFEEMKKKQQIHVPLTGFQSIVLLTKKYQGSDVFTPSNGHAITNAYWQRTMIYVGIVFGIIPVAIALYFTGWVALLWLIIVGYIVLHRYVGKKNFRWQVNHEGLQMYGGAWGRKYTLLKWNKVQQLQVSQNLFQKSKKVASLIFVTAAGKVTLPYIEYQTAIDIANQVLYLVEKNDEPWL